MPVATELRTTSAQGTNAPARWLTPKRISVYAATLLLIECVIVITWWYGHSVIANPTIPTMGWDFVVYWSASGLAQTLGAPAAYDWTLLRAAEAGLLPNTFGPFAYPPTFLLLIYPIGALSFGLALILFSLAGIVLYLRFVQVATGGQYRHWLLPALAFPGIWTALLAGQNSLFTMAAAGAALWLMRRHAVIAGACIALLCIKPQLGVLFPLLLLCERRWTVFAAAAGFSVLFIALTTLAFGFDIYPAFANSMAMFREAVTLHSGILRGAPTVFAVLLIAGIDIPVAYGLHAVVALCAAGICAWLWSARPRLALSASALAIGTLIVQPYLLYYDLAWLAIPLALLFRDMARHGSQRWERLLFAVTWLVPAHAMLAVPGGFLQLTPLVLIGLLGLVVRRHLTTHDGDRVPEAFTTF